MNQRFVFAFFSLLVSAPTLAYAQSSGGGLSCSRETRPSHATRITAGVVVAAVGTSLAAGSAYGIASHRDTSEVFGAVDRTTGWYTVGLAAGLLMAGLGTYVAATPSLSSQTDCLSGVGPGAWLWPTQGQQ